VKAVSVAGLMAAVSVCGVVLAGPALAKTISPLGVVTTYLPAAAGGSAYSAQLAATGGTKPYTWSISAGSLPAGLTLHPATGAITGKPVTPSETADFTVEVTDSEATPASATGSETITVTTAPPAVTTTSLPAATDGAPYSAALAATGGITPYTWSLSGGSLPAGLTLHPSGTISGTPKAGGTADFTVEVADSASPFETAIASLSITVNVASLVVTTASNLPTAYTSAPYSVKLGAAGGTTPYTWSVTSGSLPAGLKLHSNGTLSGTPSATGTATFTVQAADAENPAATATASLTLTVAAPLTITTTSLPDASLLLGGYQAYVDAAGGVGPYTWSIISGSLPPDLAMEGQGSSAEIAGVLSANPGVYSFVVKVTDSANPAESATADLSITVTVAP
jgi:hypothetical protein